MTWQSDNRRRRGGWWRCRVRRREYNQNRSAQRVAWVQERRENTLFRIAEQLYNRRRRALQRMAERHLPREDSVGEI